MTLRYNCDAGGDAPDMHHETGGIIENAYHTVMKDFHVDLFNNSVRYVPQNSPKKLMKEIVIYDKSIDKDCYEKIVDISICTKGIMTVTRSNTVNIFVAIDCLTPRLIIRDATIFKSRMKR